MLRRINKGCSYFPCHKGLQDCTFCYCPFYPCLNNKLGGYIFAQRTNQHIWSCKNCVWIHKKMLTDNILRLIREGSINPRDNSRKTSAGRQTTGIIILGHGSKVKKTNATIRRVIKAIKLEAGLKIVEPAYLQLCGPSLHTSVKKIIKKGVKKIVVAPFFLFTGNHVGRDIPKEIKQEAELFKGVEFVYAKNLGDDPAISGIVLKCIENVLKSKTD